VLGFEIVVRFGREAAFVSAGGYHHHIGLNTWKSLGGSPPPPGATGLYHLAILYPTQAELADALGMEDQSMRGCCVSKSNILSEAAIFTATV